MLQQSAATVSIQPKYLMKKAKYRTKKNQKIQKEAERILQRPYEKSRSNQLCF